MRTPTFLVLALLPFFAACGGGGGGGGDPTADSFILYDFFEDETAAHVWFMDGHVPGLVTFNLEFLNGDHHIHRIAAGGVGAISAPDPTSFRLELHDGDNGPFGSEADDPVEMLARYVDLSSVGERRVVVGEDLSNVARLPLDLEPREKFVLSGFAFQTDGGNHHLRVLRVEPFPERGYVEVEYADDSPGDDLYSAVVAYVVVPADHGGHGPDSPRVVGPFESTYAFAGRTTTAPRRSGFPVMQGFSLRFREGDRHVEGVEVDLGWPDAIFTSLRDGDVDPVGDIVDARVTYHLLHR